MGVVTAQVAGRAPRSRSAPRRAATARSTRSCWRACRLAGASTVYRMGGAQAIAALAYGTETVAAGRRDRRPGQPVRAGGQAPGVRPGRDRRLRRAERPAGDRRSATSIPSRSRSTCSPRPSTGRARWWSAVSTSAELLDELDGAARRRRRTPARWSGWSRSPTLEHGAGAGRGVRARAPQLVGPRRRGAGAAGHARRLRVRRRRRRARRSATTSPAPTTCCRPTARPASPRRCRRRTSAAASPRCGSATPPRAGAGRGAGGPRRGLRAPRPVDGGAHSRQWQRDDARRRDRSQDRGDRGPRRAWRSTATGAGERDTGVGFLDHMLDLLARHGRLDLSVQRRRRPADRRPPHGRGRRHLHRPGARPGARRPRRDRPLRPGHRADGRVAGRRARSTSPDAACARSRPTLPPGAIGNFDHELTEEFFRALAANAQADAAPDASRPAPTPTT